MSFSKMISQIPPEDFGPFTEGITQAQQRIPRAGRFRVVEAVMDAMGRMQVIPFSELLPLLPLARLPFPITWIEWSRPGGGGHIGYLCEELPDGGFAFRQYGFERKLGQQTGLRVVCTRGRIRIEPAGWTAEDPHDEQGISADPAPNYLELAASDILRLLLMINSPSQVFVIEEPDNAALNAKRARKGRAPILDLKTIKFDMFRFQQAAREGIPLRTEGEVAEHFVRGHFKTLRTGLFWWSPHVRYQMGDEPRAAPKDYDVDVD
jgi:hypothetical protein